MELRNSVKRGNRVKVFGHFSLLASQQHFKAKAKQKPFAAVWQEEGMKWCGVQRERRQDRSGGDGSEGDAKREWKFLVVPKRLCTPRRKPLVAYEYCNCGPSSAIHITLTYFWFWGEGARRQHNSTSNTWVEGKVVKCCFWQTLGSADRWPSLWCACMCGVPSQDTVLSLCRDETANGTR